ncbi:MAG: NUDIX hydrolase [Desulfomonilaceae bacterium]|jgi:ADP-ribose pyrophosphatase YjhB (NUDIX family)
MKTEFVCPKCGSTTLVYRNPLPTVDIIIRIQGGFILIKRKNPPFGWALPGGFVDYGESVENAAVREAKEETSLDITDLKLLGVYSAPERDPRRHTISTVFTARGHGAPEAGDDAIQIQVFNKDILPKELAFDHLKILQDFFSSGY